MSGDLSEPSCSLAFTRSVHLFKHGRDEARSVRPFVCVFRCLFACLFVQGVENVHNFNLRIVSWWLVFRLDIALRVDSAESIVVCLLIIMCDVYRTILTGFVNFVGCATRSKPLSVSERKKHTTFCVFLDHTHNCMEFRWHFSSTLCKHYPASRVGCSVKAGSTLSQKVLCCRKNQYYLFRADFSLVAQKFSWDVYIQFYVICLLHLTDYRFIFLSDVIVPPKTYPLFIERRPGNATFVTFLTIDSSSFVSGCVLA